MPTPAEILDELREQHTELSRHVITAEASALQRLALNVYNLSVEVKRLDDQLSGMWNALGAKWAPK